MTKHGEPLDLSPQERERLFEELTEIRRQLDELPDDAYAARIDLRERRDELRMQLREAIDTAVTADEEVVDLRDDEPTRRSEPGDGSLESVVSASLIQQMRH